MIRAWRNELLCVAAAALALVLLGLLTGYTYLALGFGVLVYLGWHLFNFVLLQLWIGRRRRFRLPLSFGVWEAVFDGLQREQLRNRKRKRQLAASLGDYRKAAEILPDAFVVLSETGTVRWFNPAARRLLGLRWPADVDKDVTKVITHPVLEDNLEAGRSSRPLEVPSPINGAWMLNIQVTAPFGKLRERILIARDMTAVFRLEQARRDFLASVSHELRTPITVFRGYLETLQDVAAEDPQLRVPVNFMNQQARRMQALVDDLLTLSRLEMTDRPKTQELVPVPEMLAQIVSEARAFSGEKKHDVRLRADPSTWLWGDDGELHSAFSNLIFNAVRHTPPGTKVDVDWAGNEDGATLSVRDSGPGIAAYHLPRLTERFYRIEAGRSRDSGGSGLGLAITKQVLDRYRSELRIASKVGKGTTFSCHFPGSLVHLEPEPALEQAG